MNSIKFIVLIISILVIFCSCTSKSAEKSKVKEKSVTSKRRALSIYKASTGDYIVIDSAISIINVDTLHKTGDMIIIDDARYRIID